MTIYLIVHWPVHCCSARQVKKKSCDDLFCLPQTCAKRVKQTHTNTQINASKHAHIHTHSRSRPYAHTHTHARTRTRTRTHTQLHRTHNGGFIFLLCSVQLCKVLVSLQFCGWFCGWSCRSLGPISSSPRLQLVHP